MPNETQQAVDWALQQTVTFPWGTFTAKELYTQNHAYLVDHVREYFNERGIVYGNFSFNDLEPYL